VNKSQRLSSKFEGAFERPFFFSNCPLCFEKNILSRVMSQQSSAKMLQLEATYKVSRV
jgi:hypothetical protein